MNDKYSQLWIISGFELYLLRFRLRLSFSVNGRRLEYSQIVIWLFRNVHTFFIVNGNLAEHSKIKNIYIFECEWPNDLCTAKWQFDLSHSNLNANGTEGYRMHTCSTCQITLLL